MAALMNIGFGNVVNTDKIVAVIQPDSAPAKRMIQKAKEEEAARQAEEPSEPQKKPRGLFGLMPTPDISFFLRYSRIH